MNKPLFFILLINFYKKWLTFTKKGKDIYVYHEPRIFLLNVHDWKTTSYLKLFLLIINF